MQREFEKQVKQKMDELKLSPSAPVWQHIQMEINPKQDHRKFFLWVFLAVLLTGSGIWYFTTEMQNQQQASGKLDQQKIPRQIVQSPINENEQAKTGKTEQHFLTEKLIISDKVPALTTAATTKIRNNTSAVPFLTGDMVLPVSVTTSDLKPIDQINIQPNKSELIHLETNNSKIDTADEVKTAIINQITDSSFQPGSIVDTLVAVPLIKSNVAKKWVVGLTAGAGKSQLVSGIGSLNKSADQLQASPIGNTSGFNALPPAKEQPSFTFSIGGILKRQLSNRFAFTSGVSYSYLSTKHNIGQAVRRDTVLSTNSGTQRVSQYYQNSIVQSSLADQNSVTGQYHFISIPVGFDFKIINKIPLNLNTGISLQYLLYTNTLSYHTGAGVYYHNKDAFKRLQLFGNASLTYGVSDKWSFGPYMQYGFTNTLKANNKKHLQALGIKTEFLIK